MLMKQSLYTEAYIVAYPQRMCFKIVNFSFCFFQFVEAWIHKFEQQQIRSAYDQCSSDNEFHQNYCINKGHISYEAIRHKSPSYRETGIWYFYRKVFTKSKLKSFLKGLIISVTYAKYVTKNICFLYGLQISYSYVSQNGPVIYSYLVSVL